ncbi:MAG: hypothetical protein QXW37_07985 [Candidatus Nitrosotenuis sp.]
MKLALFAFVVISVFCVQSAYGHSLFNSAESTIGNNRVQIATDPEIPQIDDKVKVLLRVTDLELNEVPRFTVGIRIFYNDIQVDGIPPQSIEGGHWGFDYVFKKAGNHIFRVDLYDSEGKVITHTFNVSTQSPFGYIFIYVIVSGAIGLAIVVGYIYLPKLRKVRH